jgi:tape measure domain-containing protein
MLGDAQAAKSLQGQLIEFAKVTPFSLLEVQQGTKQLLAMGASFDQVLPEMQMLGDISAGLAVPMERLILNFGQVRVQGKLTGRELRDFSVAGVPLLETLSDTMGKTKKELIGMVSEGKIGFKDVKTAFQVMTGEGGRFFELMDAQSKTVGGRLSNLGDSWEQLQVQIGRSQTGIINGTVDWVASMVGKLEELTTQSNRMEDAFKMSGASSFTALQKMNNFLIAGAQGDFANFITGGIGDIKMLDRSLQSLFVKPSGESLEQAKESRLKLLQFKRGITGAAKEEGEAVNLDTFKRQIGLIDQALNTIEGTISNFGAKVKKEDMPEELDKEGREVARAGFGTGVEISGRRPQEINITIDSLVEQLNIEAATIEESNEELKEKVSQILIEVVNDANTTAR